MYFFVHAFYFRKQKNVPVRGRETAVIYLREKVRVKIYEERSKKNMAKSLKKRNTYKIWIHLFFILMCLMFVVPMILVISISFSSEESVTAVNAGYSLIPKDFSLDAYKLAFANPESVVNGYIITIAQAFWEPSFPVSFWEWSPIRCHVPILHTGASSPLLYFSPCCSAAV